VTGAALQRRPAAAIAARPERWLWAVAGAGALVLLVQYTAGPLAGSGHHAGHHAVGLSAHLLAGAAMVAVMAPLVADNAHHAAMRSPRAARTRVTVDLVAGWAAVWAAAALLIALGAWLLARTAGDLAAIAGVTAVAAAWQYTPLKRRGLARCHRLLAPPLERQRARRACSRAGVWLGRDCVLSCWGLMALVAVAGHSPLVVVPALGVAWHERRRPHHDPATTETALAVVAIGATAFLVALLSS
jgi:predicted metal-binding membrane protein